MQNEIFFLDGPNIMVYFDSIHFTYFCQKKLTPINFSRVKYSLWPELEWEGIIFIKKVNYIQFDE